MLGVNNDDVQTDLIRNLQEQASNVLYINHFRLLLITHTNTVTEKLSQVSDPIACLKS